MEECLPGRWKYFFVFPISSVRLHQFDSLRVLFQKRSSCRRASRRLNQFPCWHNLGNGTIFRQRILHRYPDPVHKAIRTESPKCSSRAKVYLESRLIAMRQAKGRPGAFFSACLTLSFERIFVLNGGWFSTRKSLFKTSR